MKTYKFRQFIAAMTAICVILGPAVQVQAASQTASTADSIAPETLDTLLAPIALYPDALILQVAQCAGSPFQIKQLNQWLKQNPTLQGTAIQDGAKTQGFDDEFIAISIFPDVVQMMAEKPDWTHDLGQAFEKDHDGVFDSIQRLRTKAQNLGNLTTTQQQTVQTVSTQTGQQVIVVQPANPQVVYVPQYNPQVVYSQPAPAPAQTTTTTTEKKDDSGKVAAAALVGFAAGVIIAAAADDDDDHYYYNCGGWGYHGPVLYSGGYNDYYQHRENMANDYYDHRENMADQRGENQGNRQDARSQNQATRNDNQTTRQSTRSDNQSTRQSSRSTTQSSRQTTTSRTAATAQSNRAAATSRGSFQNRLQSSSRTNSGGGLSAFSGFQRGSTERTSSSRGQSSLSSRFSGSRSSSLGSRSSRSGSLGGSSRGSRRR